jgi:hypothetical protein
MELLAKLLGGADRVKIMRLFLHQEDTPFSLHDICEKSKSKSTLVRKELTTLSSLGFIEKKKTKTYVTVGSGKKTASKIKDVVGFSLNKNFPHNHALKELLFDFQSIDKKELALRFKLVGRIKLFITSGVFIGDKKSRVDVLLVGEAINRAKAEKAFEILGSELGRDVVYSIMDVEEYEYRFKMYDKFVREIIDMPHETVIDKMREKVIG